MMEQQEIYSLTTETKKTKPKICLLCRRPVRKGLQHHYPLTRELGEEKTILVHPSCHQRDHQLFNRLVKEVERGDVQLDLEENDPYADRRAKIKVALERIRSSKYNQKRLINE